MVASKVRILAVTFLTVAFAVLGLAAPRAFAGKYSEVPWGHADGRRRSL
jgi:hypothetical protein